MATNRQFSLEVLESFSGGLNLRSDQFNLQDNESPDLLNVTVDPRGGIRMRDGVDRRNVAPLSHDVQGMWGFHTDTGSSALMVNYGTKVAYSLADNFTDLTNITPRTDKSRVYGMTMNNIAYGVSYDKPSFRWNGSVDADLGSAFGVAGNMPQAQYVAFWNNFAWVANTFESGTGYKYRLRWSNSNNPETWSAEDYVDIDKGEHGDFITALVPAGDHLLVFKTNSVYAVYGFDSDSFQVVTLSNDIGSVPLSSPVNTPYGTFFWYGREGIYVYNGDTFTWLFSKLRPAIDNENIVFAKNPQIAWGNNKLYVSVDYQDAGATGRRTFVYDPTLGTEGAWTLTDISSGPLFSYRPPDAATTVFAGCVEKSAVIPKGCVVDVEDEQKRDADRYTSNTETHISSYFVTRWVTGKDPIVKKRWGRPRTVVSAEEDLTLNVDVFKDYDKSTAAVEFPILVSGKTSASRWGTAEWDETAGTKIAKWDAIGRDVTAEVINLPTLGTGRSVSMRIDGPTSVNLHWEINALAFTYTPRRLR
jgi:hypothetical protein